MKQPDDGIAILLADRVWNVPDTSSKDVLQVADWWLELDASTPPADFVRLISTYLGTDVKYKSSPGFPYCLEDVGFASNEAFIKHWGLAKIADDVWQRIRKLSTLDMQHDWTAQSLTFQDYCDPIRVFIKNELHSDKKAEVGRWRLIMSISLIDQLVERVLHGPLNNWEIKNYTRLPFMPGMGHGTFENYEAVYDRVWSCCQPSSVPGYHQQDFFPLIQVLGNSLVQSDVSHFDWCVSDKFLDLDILYRMSMVRKANESCCSAFDQWAFVARARAKCLAMSELVLRDGTSIVQSRPGIQKSGSYNTSSTNSHIRVMLRMAAVYALNGQYQDFDSPIQPLHMVAMGDDAVEAFPLVQNGDISGDESDVDDEDVLESLLQHYNSFGFRMKQLQIVDYMTHICPHTNLTWRVPSFEFCGHIYTAVPIFVPGGDTKWEYKWFPTRPEKLLLNLLVRRPNSKQDYYDRLNGLKVKFLHMPDLWLRYEKLIQAVGWVEPEK